ncbi:Eaa1 [Klebsiella pneumoniae]|nr:Eaa1 [Klebsiella pneumoniae]
MTKSTITREQLLEIIETDHVQCGEASYLASMALAAMDSEPVIVVGDDGGDALSYRRLIQSFEPGTKLYRHAQPVPVAPVIPDEMTPEQAYEIGYYYGDPVDVFARGANWMRQHIIDSTLADAPQEVRGE